MFYRFNRVEEILLLELKRPRQYYLVGNHCRDFCLRIWSWRLNRGRKATMAEAVNPAIMDLGALWELDRRREAGHYMSTTIAKENWRRKRLISYALCCHRPHFMERNFHFRRRMHLKKLTWTQSFMGIGRLIMPSPGWTSFFRRRGYLPIINTAKWALITTGKQLKL